MQTIVIGSLNTDLVAVGVQRFPKPGEHVYGKELRIGPGGKSRNIADMIAHLAPAGSVAMVGRTVRDPYGLWQQPMDALRESGVNTDYVHVLDFNEAKKLPGIALIPVDEQGNNQIFVLPGISDDFSVQDVDSATPLFETAGKNQGALVLTLECPLQTAIHAVKKADEHGLKVLFDPGGIEPNDNVNELLQAGIYLIKPNEHEAKILTGVDVLDFESAQKAAKKLQETGIKHVLITVGGNGAYLFNETAQQHLKSQLSQINGDKDETGCGDQTMAALCAFIQEGKSFEEAAQLAVLAGTLQFHKLGIQPVTKEEISAIRTAG
ncbi:MAG TPA: PfkB family carbohydrate kinase [Candidatus Saccharimonadales bacterium]|nr:PfkB family carbohydrate kinase [Candidatus Saccharimonadales bacterium]